MFTLPFTHYVFRLLALLAVAFFTSGSISWIAANWSFFGKIEKLTLLEALFGLSLLIGLVIYYRELRRKQPHFQSQLWLFMAAVLIGGLFALIGQIYQTGANTWQLFAIWALLQLPLLYALPNIANLLLWLVTFNTSLSLALLLQGQSITELFWMSAINLPLLFAIERYANKFHDHKFIAANLIFAWLLIIFVAGGVIEPLSRLLFWVLSAGLTWYFRHHYSFWIWAFIYAVVEGNIIILDSMVDMNGIVLIMLFNLMATIFAAMQLSKRYSFLGRVLLVFISLIFIVSFLAFCFFIVGIDSEFFLLILAIGLFSAAFFIERSVLRDAILVMSVVTAVIAALNDQPFRESIALGVIALYIFGYYREKTFWLQVILSLGILCIFFINFTPYLTGFDWSERRMLIAHNIYVLLPLLCLLAFILDLHRKSRIHALGWGILLFLLIIGGMQAVSFSEISANPETQLHSIAEFFHAITLNFFQHQETSFTWYLQLISALTALWLTIWLIYQRKIQGIDAVALVFSAVLLSLSFIANPLVGLLFSLLLVTYFQHNKMLWSLCIIGLLLFLTLFYYNLTISLLFKSLLLMGNGAILGGLALSIHRRQQKPTIYDIKMKKRLLISSFVCLVATLGLANFSIWQFEEILQNGEKIVLKLAPIDPRSLMQGDYMELNYEILADVNQIPLDDNEKQHQLYVYLHSRNGMDAFCGYTLLAPEMQFEQCRENIYLPIKIQMGEVKMAGMHFFFPEGQREHFEQAEYGEFRFKNGKLLLLNLLDKAQNPL